MRGDWIVGAESLCPVNIPVTRPCNTEPGLLLATDNLYLSLIDSGDLQALEDSCTVMRVVGDVAAQMSATLGNPLTAVMTFSFQFSIHEGIFVAGADGTTPTANVMPLDPRLSADLELDSWLWLRNRDVVDGIQIPANSTILQVVDFTRTASTGYEAKIDSRVKRKLKRGQELVYVAACSVSAFPIMDVNNNVNGNLLKSFQFSVTPHLRCYVKF